MDVVRVNFSHGSHDDHIKRAETVRNRARAHGRQVGVLADLQGPKIRIERFAEGRIRLKKDDEFVLDVDGSDGGDQERVGVTYKELPRTSTRGDTLLARRRSHRARGWRRSTGTEVACRVVVGGDLSTTRASIARAAVCPPGALTDKDREDIRMAAEMKADYVAISFPRSADDIDEARQLLRAAGGHGGIVAKIERAEAVEALEEIIKAADAIMIARGDLGVEIGDAELPAVQKRIIQAGTRT